MSIPPALQAASLYACIGVRHGFFGREGGVSDGVYASLNCGPGSNDKASAIADNRARVAAALGVRPSHLLSAFQIHSNRCITVDAPFADPRPQADAMVTATPGLALGVLTADCAPVLFCDPVARVIGAAHAGWRGAVSGVLESTLAAMTALGADLARIHAAIGPCIGQMSYEVGPELRHAALDADAGAGPFFAPSRDDRLAFDLEGYCAHRLLRAGLTHCDMLGVDTYTDAQRCFSFRRTTHAGETDYGRQISAVVLV